MQYERAPDADIAPMSEGLPDLQAIRGAYQSMDIWNANDTDYNYGMSPNQSIARAAQHGRKKNKRIALLCCTNADGTESFPLFIISTARSPRYFQNKSAAEHSFDYGHNKKGWMAMPLFSEWLVRFNRYVKVTDGRRVLLLMDKFSWHRKTSSISELSSVRVKFLPPNTTSKLQPMDMRIISSLRRCYRTSQYNRAFDAPPTSDIDIYAIDQLNAMKYLKKHMA